jgi:hypothetical protein
MYFFVWVQRKHEQRIDSTVLAKKTRPKDRFNSAFALLVYVRGEERTKTFSPYPTTPKPVEFKIKPYTLY